MNFFKSVVAVVTGLMMSWTGQKPQTPEPVKAPVKAIHNNASYGQVQRFLYRFEGRAMYKGSPVSGAKVLVRINTSKDAQVKNVSTDSEGNYIAEFQVAARTHEPINWSMEGYTADLRKVKLLGQRIAMKEDDSLRVVNTPLELARAEDEIVFPKAIF